MSLLEIVTVSSRYGDLVALAGLSLHVDEGEVVAIIGANGAGKSTLLRAIAGLQPLASGSIRFDARPLEGTSVHRRVQLGLSLAPEGRRIFPSLSVEENLRVGGDRARPGPWTLDAVYGLFPLLRDRSNRSGAVLSGGEQQALAIGRALMANPRLLMLDEVSLGLAPVVVKQLYAALPAIVANGVTVLLVEQSIDQARAAAARLYCLLEGRIALQGAPSDLSSEAISAAYFGIA